MRFGLIAVGVGGSVAVVLGGWPGVAAGTLTAVVLWRVLPRWIGARVDPARRRAATDLPLAADLMAAALGAGAPGFGK